jgi:putative FmdB family regulatory protein
MPTYEYACKTCGEHLEVVQSFKDDALTECPSCGGALRKVFGNIGISFRGSGFYKTDNRSDRKAVGSSAPAAKGETKAESTTSGSAASTSSSSAASSSSSTTTSGSSAVA